MHDFDGIFEFVKYCVSSVFKMNRTGLNLVLQGLPNNLGAYHIMGSNIIVANRFLLESIKNNSTKEEYNSYVFSILAHEYLHSLGIVDESKVRNMTYILCLNVFGEEHTTTKFAKNPLDAFPYIAMMKNGTIEKNFIQVKKFDNKNQSYIQ